jgi:hypothetical protein
VAVEQPVVVAVAVERIGLGRDLEPVVEAVAVGVGLVRVGAQRLLLAVAQAVAVAVALVGVGVRDVDLGAVVEAVAVAVGLVGVGVRGLDLRAVAQAVTVRVGLGRVGAVLLLLAGGQAVAVGAGGVVLTANVASRLPPLTACWPGDMSPVTLNVGPRSGSSSLPSTSS